MPARTANARRREDCEGKEPSAIRAAMSVDADTVRRIAHLARIAVADGEVEHLRGELNAMLAFVEQLQEVDVEGVEPMTSVTPMDNEEARRRGHRRRHRRGHRQERAGERGPFFPRAQSGRVNVHRLRNELLEHDRRAAAGGSRTASCANRPRALNARRPMSEAPPSAQPDADERKS